jgi:hypothetical protein
MAHPVILLQLRISGDRSPDLIDASGNIRGPELRQRHGDGRDVHQAQKGHGDDG